MKARHVWKLVYHRYLRDAVDGSWFPFLRHPEMASVRTLIKVNNDPKMQATLRGHMQKMREAEAAYPDHKGGWWRDPVTGTFTPAIPPEDRP